MKYYPVNLDIRNRRCLVVGGGNVATRKVNTLLECGAMVTVVALEVTDPLVDLAGDKKITLKRRHYQSADLNGMFLIIAATDREEINWRIHSDAERIGKLCNVVDRPESCNFILPSVVNRGDLIIAISTSGSSPAFAKKMRLELEKQFGEEYAEFLRVMRAVREQLLIQKENEPEAHKPIFEKLIDKGLLEMIRNGKKEDANHLLFKVLGKGYSLDSLIKKET
jgi:precorrin-2 dehydrogenase/sirohydrochlorin ferrochelatase